MAGAGVKLYVGNLTPEVTAELLQAAFTSHGDVLGSWVAKGPAAFGFVTMKTLPAAQTAVEALNGTMLGGAALRVELAAPITAGPVSGSPPAPRVRASSRDRQRGRSKRDPSRFDSRPRRVSRRSRSRSRSKRKRKKRKRSSS
mmetsp:Transcript_45696/g.104361  ORF Transcript_45696/g.104361 Transcript_45696/m.104361 type:complete len:143 (+) Transcript_45696:106-534(+)